MTESAMTPGGQMVVGVAEQTAKMKLEELERLNPEAYDWLLKLAVGVDPVNLPVDMRQILLHNGFVDNDGVLTEYTRTAIFS